MQPGITPIGPHQAWLAWNDDLWTLLALLALGAAYVRGLEVLRQAHPRARGLPRRRVLAFAAGFATLVLAVASPLHVLGHTLLSAHMLQHVLLMMVAPPLLIAGRTVLVTSWASPAGLRTRMHDGLHTLHARRWRSATVAGLVWVAHLGVLWGWHVPRAYEAALRLELVHAVEHATMLGAACLFWWAIVRRGVLRYGAGVLALAATAAGSSGLGALLTFGDRAWYTLYDPSASGWALSTLDDQHLAGALMWVLGGLAYTAAAVVVFAWWLQALDRRASRRPSPAGALGVMLVVLALGASACQADPAPAVVAQGEQALVDYGCVSCHAVAGLDYPQGQVGPSLDDVTQRQTLAGNLPNTRDNLRLWIQDPQEVDPGNLMPDLDVTDEDATAIIEYLSALP